jgi:putative ABC transport system permease protein
MLRHYFRVGLRNLLRAPLTSAVNLLALALGLAAFITAYGVVDYWSMSERHFANADRTYVVTVVFEGRNQRSGGAAPAPITNRLFADYLRTEMPELEAVARAQGMGDEAAITAGDVKARMFMVAAESSLLEIFDFPFLAGDPANALRDPNSVVLTRDAATRLFGRTDVVGRTVTLQNLLDATVTGVIDAIPEPSHFGRTASATLRFDVLASWDTLDGVQAAQRARDAGTPGAPPPPPANAPPPPENWLGGYCCTTYLLTKRDDGATPESVNAALRDFGDRHVPVAQKELATLHVGAVPIRRLMVSQLDAQLLSGAGISITALLLALGAVVLVVACVNYANLATAQATRRAREIGLRKSLGAARREIMLQYLAEAAVLTTCAAVLALVVVAAFAPALRGSLGIDLELSLLGGTFWAFLAAAIVGVTLLAAAYPAFLLARVAPIEALRTGRTKRGPRFAGTVLVGLQFAAASFLMILVSVMYAQNDTLRRTALGGSDDPVAVIPIYAQLSRADNATFQEEVRRLPQVVSVASAQFQPWDGQISLAPVARAPDDSTVPVTAFLNFVGFDFFSTTGSDVIAGRVHDRDHGEDLFAGTPNGTQTINIVIDESLSRQLAFQTPQAAVDQVVYFPESVTRAFATGAPQALRVIGVVADRPLHLRGAGATANLYWVTANQPVLLARLKANDVAAGLAGIDAIWNRLSPNAAINRRFMDELFDRNYENFARINQAFAGLALVAVAISVIGLFGMAVQVASRRIHEIGVRKSVGAHTGQIVTMLIAQFSRPVWIANLVAWPLAYIAAERYLAVFIQRVEITAYPFVASLLLSLGIALVAVGSQAWRAARVSPATVLRAE